MGDRRLAGREREAGLRLVPLGRDHHVAHEAVGEAGAGVEQELATVGLELGDPDEVGVERAVDQIDRLRHERIRIDRIERQLPKPGDSGLLNKSLCQER